MGKHHDWSNTDWSKTSAQIAAELGCPKTTVDSARQRFAPNSRTKRPRKPKLIVPIDDPVLRTIEFLGTLPSMKNKQPEEIVMLILQHFIKRNFVTPPGISPSDVIDCLPPENDIMYGDMVLDIEDYIQKIYQIDKTGSRKQKRLLK